MSDLRVWSLRFGNDYSELRFESNELRIWGLGFSIQSQDTFLTTAVDVEGDMPGPGFIVQGLGPEVWGLGFGVWGLSLGFGVWGVGFGV